MVDKAYRKGLMVVAASGDSGNEQGIGDNINYPAKYFSVLSVSAVDKNWTRASFSSTGEKIDFSEPGSNILSTHFEGGYAFGSRTSQAAPDVTGFLALLKQAYPTKTNDELVKILKSHTKDLGAPGKDPWYGYGIAQYQPLIPIGYIDAPSNGTTITGHVNVSGWFLDGSGVSSIEVLIDGKSIGSSQNGIARPDVNTAFPLYKNSYSGFVYMLNTNLLSNGDHLLTMRETGSNGKVYP